MTRYRIIANGNTIYDTQDKNTYPVVKPQLHQELNNAGTLSFTVIPGHPYYNNITKMQTFVTVYKNNDEIFYGRVLRTEKGLDGQLNVDCEGGITFFLDSEMGKVEVTETVQAFFTRCINNHNSQVEAAKRFTIGTISVAKKNESHAFKITDWEDTKSTIESNLLGQFGGFLNVRPKNGGGHYIDYVENFGRINTQPIQIGVNIIDKDDSVSGENIFTILHPLGKTSSSGAGQDTDVTLSGLSQSDISLQNVTLVGQNLELTDKISLYGRITRTERFPNAEKAIDLLHKAEEFITRMGTQLPATCDINLVNFNLLNPEIMDIFIGDTFNNIEGFSGQTLTVGEIDTDLENPSNDKIVLKNEEEINSDRFDPESSSSSKGLSDKVSKNKQQEAFRYKYIREEEDKLILFAKNTEINASEKFSALSNKIFLTAEENEAGEPGELVLRAVKNVDDPYGSSLVMTVNGISLNTITDKTTVDGVEEIKGTSIYQHRDHIDAVAGKWSLDLQGNVHVIDGSNLYLGEGNASLAVYTDGNLTGGILVDKINNDGTVTTQTQIKGDLVNISANEQFTSLVGDVNTQGTQITQNKNNINLKVNADGVISSINMSPESVDIEAQKVNLSGYTTIDQFRATKGVVDNMFNGNTHTGSLSVSSSLSSASVYSDAYYIGRSESSRMVQKVLKIGTINVSGGQMVGLGTAGDVNLTHYHDITAVADQDGHVTITIGEPSSTSTPANFNIADTEFYKNAMRNIRVSNVSVNLTGTPMDDGVYGYIMQSGSVGYSVNGVAKSELVSVNVTTAYEAGRVFGQDRMGVVISGSSIKCDVSGTKKYDITVDVDQKYNSNLKKFTALAVVYANGNAIASDTQLSGSDAYDAGVTYGTNNVTMSASGITEYQNAVYNSTTHNSTVYIRAEASNGKYAKKTFTVSGASAYDGGYASAKLSKGSWTNGRLTISKSTTGSNSQSVALTLDVGSFNSSTHKSRVTVYDNGSTTECYTDVDASGVYNGVTVESIGKDGNTRFSTNYKTVYIPVTATASNGKSKSDEVSSAITDAYEYAETAGKNSVTIKKGPWSNGVCTFTKSAGTASSKTVSLVQDETTTWGQNNYANVAYVKVLDDSAETGLTVSINAVSRYNAGYTQCQYDMDSINIDSNGPYYPSDYNCSGFSYVYVNVPDDFYLAQNGVTSRSANAIGATVYIHYRSGGVWYDIHRTVYQE